MVQKLGCMQRLLREGGQDLGIPELDNGCVPMPACPKFRFFPGAVGSQTHFLSDLAFPRCGGTCGGRYARVRRVPPGTPAAGWSKNKNENGVPPGPQGWVRDGYRLRWVGATLWATPTPPPPLHCTGLGRRRCTWRRSSAICRPSMRSSAPAHRWTSRTTAPSGVRRCTRRRSKATPT
jgi:hypothetical protein